jgi:Flp pilus assembly protein TadD
MRFGVLTVGCIAAAAVVAPAPSAAQASYSPYNESASAALSRYLRTLASSPRDFSALIGAGRAALALGDAQAAAGFFGRADEVNSNSPLPQAGMGAVAVANGDPQTALSFFARAQQLGAPIASFGADRGLAYDLMGQQALAQADYRAALGGTDGDEARRRLAMSLAISGNKTEALQILAPLQARGDAAGARCRAFVLALTGDTKGAMVAIDAAMPGSWASVSPFLQKLPTLAAGQKAAAVNLGVFPDSGGSAYAYAPQSSAGSNEGDRLAGIDSLLKPPVSAPSSSFTPPSVQVASVARPSALTAQPVAKRSKKIWLQLASGPNSEALPSQFQRIKSRNAEVLDGIKGYIAKGADRSRLLIGPFRDSQDAETFAEGLESVNAFRWTNSETDTIVPIGTN